MSPSWFPSEDVEILFEWIHRAINQGFVDFLNSDYDK